MPIDHLSREYNLIYILSDLHTLSRGNLVICATMWITGSGYLAPRHSSELYGSVLSETGFTSGSINLHTFIALP